MPAWLGLLGYRLLTTSYCIHSGRDQRETRSLFPGTNPIHWCDYHIHIFLLLFPKGFPDSSVGKESTCNSGDPGLIPGSGSSPGEGIGYPLQYSWVSLVAQLVKNSPAIWETWVQSLGWEDPWRWERLPTPVFWLREFHGLYSPWGHKESDVTE